MTLSLPEDFFHQQIAVHVPHEHIAEFIEACFSQYGFRTAPNDTLLSWCLSKAECSKHIYVYHSGKRFSAFTDAYGGMKFYDIVQMESVVQSEADFSDILNLL